MSGRIRTIKPELLEDEKTAGLSDGAFRLFVGMILLADDYGNLSAHEKRLSAAIFWHSRESRECSRELRECLASGLVSLYEVNGQTFAHLNGWTRHQRVDKPGKPRVPKPSDGKNIEELKDSRESRESVASVSRGPRVSLAPDPDPDPDPEEESPNGLLLGTDGPSDVASGASPKRAGEIREVFGYWAQRRQEALGVSGGAPVKLTTERRRKINARLAEGYSVADLQEAVEGMLASKFNLEGGHTDVELACRSASKVDRYREQYRQALAAVEVAS